MESSLKTLPEGLADGWRLPTISAISILGEARGAFLFLKEIRIIGKGTMIAHKISRWHMLKTGSVETRWWHSGK